MQKRSYLLRANKVSEDVKKTPQNGLWNKSFKYNK